MPVACTLLIPALFIQPQMGDEYRGLAVPALETLLAHALISSTPPNHYMDWLCHAFNVERQQDYPVAPLTLAFDGVEPGNDFWLRADPVHLRIHRDQIGLMDATSAPLTQTEAEALCATLNQQFLQDGLAFLPLQPHRWYVKLSAIAQIKTVSLHDATGKNIHPLIPSGADGMLWQQRLNEIQMLLFEHPINTARESRGELPINSVWFWGGGLMPQNISCQYDSIISDDMVARSLAKTAQIAQIDLPANATQLFNLEPNKQSQISKKLIIINKLHNNAMYGDIAAWRNSIQQLDAYWFAPLLAALKTGAMTSLNFCVPDEKNPREFFISRNDLRKFWRRKKPLIDYA